MVMMSRSVRLYGEQAAGFHGGAIQRDGASPAKRCFAADMRAGKTELVSEKVDEQEARLDFSRVAFSVHGNTDFALHSITWSLSRMLIGLRYQIFGSVVNSGGFVCQGKVKMSPSPAK